VPPIWIFTPSDAQLRSGYLRKSILMEYVNNFYRGRCVNVPSKLGRAPVRDNLPGPSITASHPPHISCNLVDTGVCLSARSGSAGREVSANKKIESSDNHKKIHVCGGFSRDKKTLNTVTRKTRLFIMVISNAGFFLLR